MPIPMTEIEAYWRLFSPPFFVAEFVQCIQAMDAEWLSHARAAGRKAA